MKAHPCLSAILVFTSALLSTTANSGIYKCLIDGKTVYGEVPCPDSGRTVGEDRFQAQEKIKQAQDNASKQQGELKSLRDTVRRHKQIRSQLLEAANMGDKKAAFLLKFGDDLTRQLDFVEKAPKELEDLFQRVDENFEANKLKAARQREAMK